MKFLPAEHSDISALLISHGITLENFSFRKKRGLLHIEIVGREDTFCFYRKTESSLTESLQFEEETMYYLGQKKEVKVENWEDVLAAISKWL